MNLRAAALAIALHVALIVPPLRCTPPPPPAGGEAPFDSVLQVKLLPEGTGEGAADCPDHYIGLGFMHRASGQVLDVAAGGPAYRAGLQVGDVVLNVGELGWNKYTIGQPVLLRVQRAEGAFDLYAFAGRICYTT